MGSCPILYIIALSCFRRTEAGLRQCNIETRKRLNLRHAKLLRWSDKPYLEPGSESSMTDFLSLTFHLGASVAKDWIIWNESVRTRSSIVACVASIFFGFLKKIIFRFRLFVHSNCSQTTVMSIPWRSCASISFWGFTFLTDIHNCNSFLFSAVLCDSFSFLFSFAKFKFCSYGHITHIIISSSRSSSSSVVVIINTVYLYTRVQSLLGIGQNELCNIHTLYAYLLFNV